MPFSNKQKTKNKKNGVGKVKNEKTTATATTATATTATATTATARIEKYEIDFFNEVLFRQVFTQECGNVEFISENYPHESFTVDTTPRKSRSGFLRYAVTFASDKTVWKTENAILKIVFDVYFKLADAYCNHIQRMAEVAFRNGEESFTYELNLHDIIINNKMQLRAFYAFIANLENRVKCKSYQITSIDKSGKIECKYVSQYGSKPTKALAESAFDIWSSYKA
jgi:hypothetical protein